MADNYNINEAESGNLTPVAANEVGGVKYPRIKVGWGADGVYSETSDVTPFPAKPVAATTGGAVPYHRKATASTNGLLVKTGAAQLYGGTAFNASGATKYLKLYDKATAPTVGTDTPVQVYPLEAGKTTSLNFGPAGLAFSLGIGIGMTGALADSDTTALAANDVVLNLEYK